MAAENLQWRDINSFNGNFTDGSLLLQRPCPVCTGLEHHPLLVIDDFQFYTDSHQQPKRVTIKDVQCRQCSTIFQNPCYSPFGFDVLFREAGMSYGATQGRASEQLKWLDTHNLLKDNSVFLDIGCYEGEFLSLLPNNIRKIGVDIDYYAIERGQSKLKRKKIELIHGRFESFTAPVAPDTISMFHVLEHLPDPVSVLSHIKRISNERTNLIVEVPVLEHGKTNDINGFFSVQHMTHFSISSLKLTLSKSGWTIIHEEKIENYNGYRIIAKQKQNTEEKIDKNTQDWISACQYLSYWYKSLENISSRIYSLPGSSNVVIWGSGLHTEFLYHFTTLFTQKKGRKFILVDSDILKQGKSWRGINIYSPDILKTLNWNECILVISSYGSTQSIVNAASQLNIPTSAVYPLYDTITVY